MEWGLLSAFPMQEEMVTAPSCAGHWCSEVPSAGGVMSSRCSHTPPILVSSILFPSLLSFFLSLGGDADVSFRDELRHPLSLSLDYATGK